jgi:metal-dependent amidase/aminoacylase/carboxypeptidase family protein
MDPKAAARQATERANDELIDLSHRIHGHPGLAFEEVQAAAWLTESLAAHGFDVEDKAYGLDTAFVARAWTAIAVAADPAQVARLTAAARG